VRARISMDIDSVTAFVLLGGSYGVTAKET
jgi:hypothetical protein